MKGFLWMKNLKMLLKIALFKLSMQIYKKKVNLPKQIEAWPTFEQQKTRRRCAKTATGYPTHTKNYLAAAFILSSRLRPSITSMTKPSERPVLMMRFS